MQSPSTTSAFAGTPVAPSTLYAPLFERVQESRLFADSKTFADAVPRREPRLIMDDYCRNPPSAEADLQIFLETNFVLPPDRADAVSPAAADLAGYIRAMWPRLERSSVDEQGSAIGVTRRHVVPGGRFREIYYWDSYFTMLGLAQAGHRELVEDMIDLFADLIERFGHIPNGTRSYYLSRSQPPVFYLMVALSRRRRDPRLVSAMRREHDYWMSGGRKVNLGNGATLNRFWDDRDSPRDESWREDIATAGQSGRDGGAVYRDIRAGAESGWDFSSRWLADATTLSTIRTTSIAPCCLNALLYGLESALAEAGDAAMPAAVERRRAAIARFNWNESGGFFSDYLIDEERPADSLTAAAFYPLFTRCAERSAAVRTISAGGRLLAPGGLRTTLVETGQQWDAPNGWAPLQWIGVVAMESYGAKDLAHTVASRWIATVDRIFGETGRVFEKYDVEHRAVGAGGEYETQEGFGWTNGVTAALMAKFPDATR